VLSVHGGVKRSVVLDWLAGLSIRFGVSSSGFLFLSFNCGNFFSCSFETGPSLFAVRNVETSVDGALECSEDSVTSGGPGETTIEESLEWSSLGVGIIDIIILTIRGLHPLEGVIDFQASQKSSCDQETSAVVRGIVCETGFEAVALKFG